jgi:DNA polymerase III subunit delta'
MNINEYNDPKKSLVLFGLGSKLDFLIKLYNSKKLPRILMITGKKGIGKFTLINHFLNYIYDKDNYDLKNKSINNQTQFYKQYLNNIFSDIIYLSGDNFKNVKIDDIRDLKSKILKTNISEKERFIILDDIELFNVNSLNALLKIIEEPTSKNYFVLINNKTKTLMETIYSRSLEIKILLSNETRIKVIESLIKKNNLEVFIDFNSSNLTPGNFLLFNQICEENKINVDGEILQNLEILLNFYKKTKNINLINMILFLTDYHFYNLKEKRNYNIEKIIENKSFVISNINKFITYNLNQNSLINAISNKLSNG